MKLPMVVRALRTRHSFTGDEASFELEAAVLGRILIIPVDEEFVASLESAVSDMEQARQVKPGKPQPQARKAQQQRTNAPADYIAPADYDVGALSGFDGDD
jgi:hypothetical protein